jgi:hypothetical protein
VNLYDVRLRGAWGRPAELFMVLKQIGQDTSEAMRRLDLLQIALEEMRLQLAQLAQTEMDTKNGRANVLLIRSARKIT